MNHPAKLYGSVAVDTETRDQILVLAQKLETAAWEFAAVRSASVTALLMETAAELDRLANGKGAHTSADASPLDKETPKELVLGRDLV